MIYFPLFLILGCVLIALGVVQQGWTWLDVWLGIDFLALGVAHGLSAHRVFGKRADGTLPLWSWLVFLPLFTLTWTVWYLLRIFIREPPYVAVNEQLVVGRRLFAAEVREHFDNYVDLTAEFADPAAIRTTSAYRAFPILDACAPSVDALHSAIGGLRPGRTFVHCAQGHGRTGLFALAVLLSSGATQDVDEGLRILRAARPGIRLNKSQRRCVEAYAVMVARQVVDTENHAGQES